MDPEVADKLRDFFADYKKQNFKKGQVIIDPSMPTSGLYFLESGRVQQTAISNKGDDLAINELHDPALFPMGWLLNSTPIAHYYISKSPVVVRCAPAALALAFIRQNPDVVYDLLQRIYKGLDGYFLRMESLLAGTARVRLVAQILIHFKRFKQARITEAELASQSGITRETVSRLLSNLKNQHLVILEKGILSVPDLEKLEAVINIT